MFHCIKKSPLVYTALLIFGSLPLLWGEPITAINIEGPKRTKEETLLNIIGIRPGDEATSETADRVEQKLRKSGLFQEDLTVSLGESADGVTLDITAYDRWTLLVFPLVTASSGNLTGGAFVIESNLAGTANLLISSVLVSQSGDVTAFALFRDPTFLGSDFALTGRLSGGRNTVEITDLAEEEVWATYETVSLVPGIGTGGKLGERTEWRLSLEGELRETGDANESSLNGEGQLIWDGQRVVSIFSRGVKARAGAKTFWTPGETPAYTLSGELQGAWTGGEIFSLSGMAKGGAANGSVNQNFRLGGQSGSLTLPTGKIASDLYGNGELKGEIRFLKTSSLALTAPVFYEAGVLRDYYDDIRYYQGLGAGIRLYVDKVAIPAMGLDYRYNLTASRGGVNFFLGMSY